MTYNHIDPLVAVKCWWNVEHLKIQLRLFWNRVSEICSFSVPTGSQVAAPACAWFRVIIQKMDKSYSVCKPSFLKFYCPTTVLVAIPGCCRNLLSLISKGLPNLILEVRYRILMTFTPTKVDWVAFNPQPACLWPSQPVPSYTWRCQASACPISKWKVGSEDPCTKNDVF